MFSRFDRTPTCDETDRQTQTQTHRHKGHGIYRESTARAVIIITVIVIMYAHLSFRKIVTSDVETRRGGMDIPECLCGKLVQYYPYLLRVAPCIVHASPKILSKHIWGYCVTECRYLSFLLCASWVRYASMLSICYMLVLQQLYDKATHFYTRPILVFYHKSETNILRSQKYTSS